MFLVIQTFWIYLPINTALLADSATTEISGHIIEVLKELKVVDPLLDVGMELERIALKDEYLISKKLYPSGDLYSGCCSQVNWPRF